MLVISSHYGDSPVLDGLILHNFRMCLEHMYRTMMAHCCTSKERAPITPTTCIGVTSGFKIKKNLKIPIVAPIITAILKNSLFCSLLVCDARLRIIFKFSVDSVVVDKVNHK